MTRRQLALAVYVPTFFLAFAQGAVVPTMPLYAKEFTSSVSLVSFAVAALALGTMFADLPVGMVMERFGRRGTMLAGTVMLAASYGGLAVAHIFPELVIYRLIGGAGTACWGLSLLAFMADGVPIASRGRSLSTYGGLQRIGTFLGPATGGAVGDAFGLRASFAMAAVLTLIAVAAAAVFVPRTRSAGPVRARHRWGVVGGTLRTRGKDVAGAGAGQIFAQMIRSGRQLIIPLYGEGALGLGSGPIGAIMSVSALIDMSLFLPAGMLMDRLGRKYAMIPSFTVMALGMALIPLAGSFATLMGAAAVIGLGNGLGAGTMMTLGADLAPREAMGEFLGLWRVMGDGGQTAGPVLAGGVADLLGLGTAALVLAGVGLLAAGTIYVAVTETLQRAQPIMEPDAATGGPNRR